MIAVFWIGLALVFVYEVWAFVKRKDLTITAVTWDWAKRYPVIPFAAGVVAGHLFWAGCF